MFLLDLKAIRYQMFSDYLAELQKMLGWKDVDDEKTRILFSRCTEYEHAKWVDIRVDGDVIGFFIIGTHENCHPSADYYIQEAYIKPEYRRRGYMSRSLGIYISHYPGVYCLLILNKNEVAHKFWPAMFEKIGYVPYELEDVDATDEHCEQYGFAPKDYVREDDD